ncbi:hypothetical protein [Helicobacter bilis]|uniref:hypothetical protein n=1 Tax=Helicobacter bilis TaxID=37372 RepID=UPI0013159B70|nr:hypothetical protein [Helicobacter bilis]
MGIIGQNCKNGLGSTPQGVIIKTKDIQEAYEASIQYMGKEWLFKKLPLQNFKKNIG